MNYLIKNSARKKRFVFPDGIFWLFFSCKMLQMPDMCYRYPVSMPAQMEHAWIKSEHPYPQHLHPCQPQTGQPCRRRRRLLRPARRSASIRLPAFLHSMFHPCFLSISMVCIFPSPNQPCFMPTELHCHLGIRIPGKHSFPQ